MPQFCENYFFLFSHFTFSRKFIQFSRMTSRLTQLTTSLRSNFIQKQNGGQNL